MLKNWLLSGIIFCLGILLALIAKSSLPLTSSPVLSIASMATKTIQYEQRNLPQAVVHILRINNQQYSLTPVISQQLNTVEEFASKTQGEAIVNAGFFDPVNYKTTSYVLISGKLVANPKDNERLINNPNLKTYLQKILNRSEFRRYQCGKSFRYDITLHNQPSPSGCTLIDAIGAGPQLLPQFTGQQEGFIDDTNGRDALGSRQPNARTAIGIDGNGDIIVLMVAQKPSVKSGMSLFEVANFLKGLGVVKAINFDGGSSSSLYYQGKSYYGKVDDKGKPVKRAIKSVLVFHRINVPSI